ncbi:MAG: LytTR family DNA-binding domain-containing protein [Coriobacteriia bacterium]|nr:LytTR family DNA-binding domain-containing protein [Coriobacteriia bacterium]
MKVIICDDDWHDREKYATLIERIAKKEGIPMELSRYDSAMNLLFDVEDSKFEADVIFMDISMPGMSGDEASRRLRNLGYLNDIVFLTVSKDYFRSAFDVKALHYVVKGETSDIEFKRIFLRSVRGREERHQEYARYVGGGENRLIKISSIRYYEIQHKIVTVHYDKNMTFQFPQLSLGTLEDELSDYGFFRIHRSYLVAISAIDKFTWKEVTLRDGSVLPFGRKHQYEELKKYLSGGQTVSEEQTVPEEQAAPGKHAAPKPAAKTAAPEQTPAESSANDSSSPLPQQTQEAQQEVQELQKA